MYRFATSFVALAATLALGCVGTLEDAQVSHMQGSLGEVDFAGEPEIREMRLDRRAIELDLRIPGAGGEGFAMVGITIPHEGLDGDALVFHPEDAQMIGCSGARDGDWDFDCEPGEYFVDVYEGKDAIGVEFEADWDCDQVPDDAPDGQPVDGYVDVDLI